MKNFRQHLLALSGALLFVCLQQTTAGETDQTVRLGNEAMRVHDYASAARFYSEAMRTLPFEERSGVMLLLVEAELRNRNVARARRVFEDWERIYAGRNAGLLPAELLVAEGRRQEAVQWLEQAVNSAPTAAARTKAQLMLAAVLLDAGRNAQAVTLLKGAVEKPAVSNADRAQLQLLLVRALLRNGELREAETVLRQSSCRSQYPLEYAKAELRIALQKKDFDAFQALWQKLPQKPEKDNELAELAMAGAELVTAGAPPARITAASELMDEAVQHSQSGSPLRAILRRKINLEMQIRPEYAVTTITRYLPEFDSPEEQRKLTLTAAELLTRQGRYHDALTWYRKLLNPAVPPLIQWKAAAQGAAAARRLDETKEEEELLNFALRQAEQLAAADRRKTGETKLLLGEFYRRSGRWAEAEKILREACAIPGPHVEESTLLLLQTLIRERKDQEALPLAQKALQFPRADHRQRAAYLQALIFDHLGRYEETLNACRKLLKEAPRAADAPAALLLSADAEISLQRYGEAAQDYLAYAEQYPDEANAPAALWGAIYATISDRDNAATEKAKAMTAKAMTLLQERYPNSEALIEAHLQLAGYYTAKGRCEEALNELKPVKAINEEKFRAEYLFRLAEVLRRQGKTKEASDNFNDISRSFSTSPFAADAYFQEGDILLEQQRYKKAILAFEEAGKRYGVGIFPLLCRGRIADSKMQWALSDGGQVKLLNEAISEYNSLAKEKSAPAIQLRSLVRLAQCGRHAGNWKLYRESCLRVLYHAKVMQKDGMTPNQAEVSRALNMLLEYAAKHESPSSIRNYLNMYASLKLESQEELNYLRQKWLGEENLTNRSRQ